MKVLIIDQFETPAPADRKSIPWKGFLDYHLNVRNSQRKPWQQLAVLKDVPEDFKPKWGTSVFIEEDGMAVLWRTNWDSSG